ncbi:MAG: 6-bladed beta-propeller [bacterium]|nr:6-bladed beta-propeller [bacterium]
MSQRKIGFAFVVLLISCSGNDKPENYTAQIIDGVKTVQNSFPRVEENESIQLEFVRKIGGLDAVDENLKYFHPVDITSDPNGNLFILDKGNYRVVKITNENDAIVIGRKGEGPGEFENLYDINPDKDGNLFILDYKKYHVYTTDGNFIRTKTLPRAFGSMKPLESGYFLSTISNDSTLLKISDNDGNILVHFGRTNKYEIPRKTMHSNNIHFIPTGDNIFVSFQHANLIQKYSSEGKLLMDIFRRLNYEITYESLEYSINSNNQVEVSGRGWSLVSKGIAIDNKDMIWVISTNRQETDEEALTPVYSGAGERIKSIGNSFTETDMYKLEVFDPEGVLITEIPLDHFCDSIKIFGDRLYIIDTFRGMCIYEYKIKDN